MRYLLALGQLVALVVVTAGCGAEAVPSDDVAAASASTKAAGTARVESVSRTLLGDGTGSYEFRETGIVDYENDRYTYVVQPSGCRTITIGHVSYSEIAPGEGLPVGKRWVKSGDEAVDNEALFEQSQKQKTSADGGITWSTIVGFAMPQPAPDEYLDYLRQNSGEPELVDEEDVRGVPTTRFRTTLDLRRVMRKGLEAEGWKAANIDLYLEDQLEADDEIDVWVDAEGLVRRIVTTTALEGAEEGMPDATVTTTEYFDFGVEVEIEPPPAAEVMGSEEWQRITEEQMRQRLDEYGGEMDAGIEPLPGAFDPSTLPGADSAQPASCLR